MKKWSVVIILAAAQFVMVLDSTVMNVSISEVVADLDTTVSGLQAAITFYTLTMAALMLTGGKLGDLWGRLTAFRIGSVIYGVGSLITALSPSLGVLLVGWSIIEGLGAVLVIPAIAALAAANYQGKDRAIAFAILGGISGAAAAAGPLIGGFMTTYLSWRYVFAGETLIMLVILALSSRLGKNAVAPNSKPIDVPSVIMSAVGMGLLVYGMLQTKIWGWIEPLAKPQINGNDIAPFGISICAYLIVAGVAVLWWFYRRQQLLESAGRNPLLKASLLKIDQLRGGLTVLLSQYLVIAAVFFVVPIYLQIVLGLDALATGIKILPLSAAVILFSVGGARLAQSLPIRRVVRLGQLSLSLGAILMIATIDPNLRSGLFAMSMFVFGAGLGLLASQLGNVNLSSVKESDSSEVGSLQGTFQNLGSSLGTALIGSVFIASLTTGFVGRVNASSDVPPSVVSYINDRASSTSLPIVSQAEIKQYSLSQGLDETAADSIANSYTEAQLGGLKKAMFALLVLSLLALPLARNIPNKKLAQT